MRAYIRKTHSPMDHGADGAIKGTPSTWAYYVELYDDAGAELVDEAGPFDDEYDAEMMRSRALEMACIS